MRLTSLSLGLLLSVSLAGAAFAQATVGGAGAGGATTGIGGATPGTATGTGAGTIGAAGGANAAGTFTAQNVDPATPFGTISIAAAGTANANMSTFMTGLTTAQRTELSQRCAIIGNTANQARYQQNARDFCTSYQTASVTGTTSTPGTSAAGSTVGTAGAVTGPGGTATGAGAAGGTQASGEVVSTDLKNNTVTLNDGKTYLLPMSVPADTIQQGYVLTITYTSDPSTGKLMASAVVITRPAAKT